MTHESWTAQLDAYLDGELEGGKMQELDRHLRSVQHARRRVCEDCRKRLVHSSGQRQRIRRCVNEC